MAQPDLFVLPFLPTDRRDWAGYHARMVERWIPRDERPEVLDVVLRWHPEGVGSSLEVDLPTLFEGIWGTEP